MESEGAEGLSVKGCVGQGRELLAGLCRGVDGDYQCNAFRADGYCILPFADISEALAENDMQVDSSILPSAKFNIGQGIEVDFTDHPRQPYWFFDNDPMASADNGRFLELPIATAFVG